MHALWFASLFSHFSCSSLCFSLSSLSWSYFFVFLPCPFTCEVVLQAMIHYCPLMDYLWVGNGENMVGEFEGYTVVVVP